MRTVTAAVLVFALFAVPAAAQAQPAPPPDSTPPPAYTPPPPPPYVPPPPYAPPPPYTRSPWYVGFALGYGNGAYQLPGERVNYRHHLGNTSPFQGAFQLEAGATLTPQLLLGGEISGLWSTESRRGVDSTLTVGQLLAVVTFFPTGRGVFLRGGAGFAEISSVLDDGFVVNRSDAYGVGLLGGAGYAWWLGRRFNLTLHGDVNLHAYSGNADAPSRSATFTGYLGFRWY